MEADGQRFVAMTDKANWFTGRIVYEGARPVAIAEAVMAPMLAPTVVSWRRAAGMIPKRSPTDRGTFYVGIERVNRIVKFDFGRYGVQARAEPVATPAEIRSLPNNRGIEGLIFVPKGLPLAGTLIAFSERDLDRAGNIRAFLIGGPTPGGFAVRRTDEFRHQRLRAACRLATCCCWNAAFPGRAASQCGCAASRSRRSPRARWWTARFFCSPTMGYQIDNMEALGVHRTAQGETVLTLLSDDNFSAVQRTLLLQFTLLDE